MEQGAHIAVSVVIPVYNGQHTICRAINSVLLQTHIPHEIIVVDDASTDGTVALLKQQYHGKIKLIEMPVNRGSSAARNAGIDAATGNYIAFLDADDTWHIDKLQVAADVLLNNPGIALLFHSYTINDISGNIVPIHNEAIPVPFIKLLPGNFIFPSTVVMKNNPAFRFLPHMRYTEDFDLFLRIAYHHKIASIQPYLTQIYRHVTSGGGISARTWQMRKGEMRAYARLANLNPLFVFLIPFLWCYSLLKHLLKVTGILKPANP